MAGSVWGPPGQLEQIEPPVDGSQEASGTNEGRVVPDADAAGLKSEISAPAPEPEQFATAEQLSDPSAWAPEGGAVQIERPLIQPAQVRPPIPEPQIFSASATTPTTAPPPTLAAGSQASPISKAGQATATLEALDGQGQVWEFDLGDRQVPRPPSNVTLDNAADWSTDLDAPDGWVDEGGKAAPTDPRRRRLFLVIAAVLAALVAGLSLPGLLNGQDDKEQPTGKTVVLGRRLSTPVALDLPKGASVTADDSYVGVQFSAGGWVLVTVPQEVYEPDGTRDPMPPDPATWLRSHPDVFVSGSRMVEVDGKSAVQIDYRRSSMAQPQSRYARLPLFCGWRGSEYYGSSSSAYRTSTQTSSRECTQITDDARVRATFIPIQGKTLLVEAVWRPYGVWGWRMPNSLRASYDDLLAGLKPRAATSSDQG